MKTTRNLKRCERIQLDLPLIYFDHKLADSVSLASGTALRGYRIFNPACPVALHIPLVEHHENMPWMKQADSRCPLGFGAWYKDSTTKSSAIGSIGSNCGISESIRHVLGSMSDRELW